MSEVSNLIQSCPSFVKVSEYPIFFGALVAVET